MIPWDEFRSFTWDLVQALYSGRGDKEELPPIYQPDLEIK